jgi:hypothetical protein
VTEEDESQFEGSNPQWAAGAGEGGEGGGLVDGEEEEEEEEEEDAEENTVFQQSNPAFAIESSDEAESDDRIELTTASSDR